MTTPAALTPALAACATTSSREAAASFATAATSSNRAINPILKGFCSPFRTCAAAEVKLQNECPSQLKATPCNRAAKFGTNANGAATTDRSDGLVQINR